MKPKCLSFHAVPACLFLALASPGFANDDMSIFSGVTPINCNNGWQDWGWVTHYLTNNPAWNGNYTMAFAASGGYQAWYLEHDPIDTTIYSSISFRLNGGSTGGQTVGLQAQAGSNWGPQVQVTAPTNSWQQFTFSLSALGVNNITNLQAIEIWNSATAQPKFYIADVRLVAAPAPATVHVNVSAWQALHTVDPKMIGVNQVAWDGAIATPTTISLLNAMGNPCLRWPGGSWGDGYHWTNEAWMYGATSARNWGSFSPNFIQVATNTERASFYHCELWQQRCQRGCLWGAHVQHHQPLQFQILGDWQRSGRQLGSGQQYESALETARSRGPMPCGSPIITRR